MTRASWRPEEKIRLRLINTTTSSYFYVSLKKQPMQVISADGIDIEPVQAKEILLGIAETYDVLWTVPNQQSIELQTTTQNVTGFASLWLDPKSEKIFAADKPLPDFYESMDHSSMDHTNHSNHHKKSIPAAQSNDHGTHAYHNDNSITMICMSAMITKLSRKNALLMMIRMIYVIHTRMIHGFVKIWQKLIRRENLFAPWTQPQ